MNITGTFNFIWNHPLASRNRTESFLRFLKWQVAQKIHPYPIVYPFIADSKLLVSKKMVGATGNIYTGLHEFNDMAFLLHFLREDELFIDIGANVGTYTVLASAVNSASTISVEPIPSTFRNLQNNIIINSILDKVIALNIGLGSAKSSIKFTAELDAINHVATSEEFNEHTIVVSVNTLDNILEDKVPNLIKIDVEGFEYDVLKGAEKSLRNEQLQAIIIEINGSSEKYGFKGEDTHGILLSFGFNPYTYSPFSRKLIPLKTFGNFNTIYIRNIDLVVEKIEHAATFNALGMTV